MERNQMPANLETAAMSQVRQRLVESLRVIDDLERFLPTDGDGEDSADTMGEKGASHGQ